MPELSFAARRVPKATYVPLIADTSNVTIGGAVLKYGFVRQLNLQTGEVAAVRTALAPTAGSSIDGLLNTLTRFEGMPLPLELPSSSGFAQTASQDLVSFGNALNTLRQTRLTEAISVATTANATPEAKTSAEILTPKSPSTQGLALHLLNSGLVAVNGFLQASAVTPIGMLNLETLEMIPAGIQRGELIATIPLAPMEQTAVVQKEWSVTSQEFTSIVTDSLDNYSETGVTDDTELAQSTTTQAQHANQFNVNATVSGNFGIVTGSVSSSFAAQDQNSRSATDSTKHAITTTKKASSRVKQSHKVTISTTTVTGSSESTTRTLQNPSPTDPMRIDYFSLVRAWHVGLYRYGLRLTYDIVIPEPAASLREAYQQLANLQYRVAQGFTFNLPYNEITDQILPGEPAPHYLVLASQFGAQVPPPPQNPGVTIVQQQTFTETQVGFNFETLSFEVPSDYWITGVLFQFDVGSIDPGNKDVKVSVEGTPFSYQTPNSQGSLPYAPVPPVDLTAEYGFMRNYSGQQQVTIKLQDSKQAWLSVTVQTAPTASSFQQWQASVWSALYNAAQTSFYTTQQALQSQITTLQNQLNNVDTLTLRREENDEITKGVLRWLLGPGFDFMPDAVQSLFGKSVTWGDAFASNSLGITATDWSTVSNYEQMVRFVNDAIDWDNILYFLYSYFWDVPTSWDNIRTIQHPDATRQAFLRAGSARIVLTVRKGWETAWVQFVEGGQFGTGALPELHPYLAIAQEIQDYDNTNYPGIPAANPGMAPDDDTYVATTSTDTVAVAAGPINLTVASNTGFIVGYQAIIDSWDSGVQETSTILAVPDDTHITVNGLTNAHDGSTNPFPVRLAGEKGLLIAEWFEYVPTSGTDIAVTSDLATIS